MTHHSYALAFNAFFDDGNEFGPRITIGGDLDLDELVGLDGEFDGAGDTVAQTFLADVDRRLVAVRKAP